MLDLILEVGTLFDWISPLVAGISDLTNGPSHTFLVPEGCGWSGRDIERLLTKYGVRLWGKMTVNRTIMFTVRSSQALWAQYLLQRAGIPTQNRPVQAPSRRGRSRRKGSKPQSLLKTLDSWLDKLV